MAVYLTRRIAQGLLALAGLLVLVFFLARLTGNPADVYLPVDAPTQLREQFVELNGFNDPVYVQFGRFLGGVLQLDLGTSLRLQAPALDLVLRAFPTTLLLAVLTMSLAIAVAVTVGSLAAWRPGSLFDRIASLLSLAGASIPNFWLAIVAVLVLSVSMRVLPTSGYETPVHWIIPVAVLMIRPCGVLVQIVRSSMMTALSSDYVKTAKVKGVGNTSIIFVHALRNSLMPMITVAGDQAANIINGAVVIETIFGFPGIGKLIMDAIMFRDFAVLQAGVLVMGFVILSMNLVIDIIYVGLDPRIRRS